MAPNYKAAAYVQCQKNRTKHYQLVGWFGFNGTFNTNQVISHLYSNRLFEVKLYSNKGKKFKN